MYNKIDCSIFSKQSLPVARSQPLDSQAMSHLDLPDWIIDRTTVLSTNAELSLLGLSQSTVRGLIFVNKCTDTKDLLALYIMNDTL